MINLLKNEIIKITHKSTFYVMMIVIFLFVITTNVIYKYAMDRNGNLNEDTHEVDEISKYQKKLEEATNIYDKVDAKTELDILQFIDKYGIDSWQYRYIDGYEFRNIVFTKNKCIYEEVQCDNILYDEYINRFDTNNYKDFLKEEIASVEKEISNYNEIINSNVKKDEINKYLNISNNKLNILKIRLEKGISYENNYLNDAVNTYESTNLIEDSTEKEKHIFYLESVSKNAISKYVIDTLNDVEKKNDNRGILVNFFVEYETMIVLSIILLCGSIVSDEYNRGTIKQLLISPNKRYKILLSKTLVTLLVIFVTFVFILLLQLLCGGIFFGFKSLSIPVIVYNFNLNKIVEYNVFSYLLLMFVTKLPKYILLSLIVLFINVLTKNTAITTILSLLIYIISPVLNTMAINNNFNFINYFVTPHWDLSIYLFSNYFENSYLNLNISIITCIIYLFSLAITMFMIFDKKDIKNT